MKRHVRLYLSEELIELLDIAVKAGHAQSRSELINKILRDWVIGKVNRKNKLLAKLLPYIGR